MCGILGSVNKYFDDSILDLIKHRGPDDSGIEEVTVNGHSVRFSQRRLSILDLSPAGHQPMFSDCGNYMIIFNGEIYNHLELRQKLSDTIKYRGHSDTETILYYLKEFGPQGLHDLNGIFALAFLNMENNSLLLARDPFGVKPLYYCRDLNSSFTFASEIRPLLKMQGRTTLNKDSLATLLRLRYNAAPDTLHTEINKILPGHYLEIDLSLKKVEETIHAFAGHLPLTVAYNQANVISLYGEKLEEAVKRQLLSDVEVGILLSGGVDSAVVAALAKNHYKGNLKAFTIGFEGINEEDEIEDAAETADFLGLEHHVKKISFTDFIDIIRKCTRIVEEPLATTSIIPMYFLAELASSKVKVVLTGQGADEPLGGYTRYKSELLRNMIPGFMRNIQVPNVITRQFREENISKGLDSLGVRNEIERFLTIWEVFKNREIMNLISVGDSQSYLRTEYFYNHLNCKSKEDSVERLMALDVRLNLADDLLNYTDKITMNFALECRVPMLDLELVRFIESLEPQLKLNLRGGKIIHKQFASLILPENIINRKKKGFLSPTNIWFKEEADLIKDLLLQSGSNFSKVFNLKYVADIINQHQLGFNQEKKIFLLLSIFFWMEDFMGTYPAFGIINEPISNLKTEPKLIRQV